MSSKQIASDTLTKIDYEDVLTESIDVLIRDYLQRIARPTTTTTTTTTVSPIIDESQTLTNAQLFKQKQMEKTANWWNKYYASKAKLVNKQLSLLISCEKTDFSLVEIGKTSSIGSK